MYDSGSTFAALDAAVRGRRVDVAEVAHEVGASAADGGVPLHEVLDHVERAHAGREPEYPTVRAAVVAWAERTLAHRLEATCEDPLTSLASAQHLRTRLEDVYRGADRDGRSAAVTHLLVVVELGHLAHGHRLEGALRALEVADVMRTVFCGDETIAQLAERRFVALARREHADDLAIHLLARLLEGAVGEPHQTRIWTERLPAEVDGLGWMLAHLSA